MNSLPTAVHQQIIMCLLPTDGRSARLSNRLLSRAVVPFQYHLDIYLRRRDVDPARFMSMMRIWKMQLAGSTVLQVLNGDYYEKSDFDLYLRAAGGSIYCKHVSDTIYRYMMGDDNTITDEKAAHVEILISYLL